MIVGSVLMTIGARLLTTFHVNTGDEKWIGYQAVYGLGSGAGLQQTSLAVQASLSIKDVPKGLATVLFA